MKLTDNEKKVLTIIQDSYVRGIEEYVKKYLELSSKEISSIIKKLIELNLVEIITLYDDVDAYYHTKKVSRDMLDDKMLYVVGHKSESKSLDNPSENLRKFTRH